MKRLDYHNDGKVKSTRNERPWRLVHQESFESLRNARKRETQIKRWKSREAIGRLLEHKI